MSYKAMAKVSNQMLENSSITDEVIYKKLITDMIHKMSIDELSEYFALYKENDIENDFFTPFPLTIYKAELKPIEPETKLTVCPNCGRAFFVAEAEYKAAIENKHTLICEHCKNHHNR